MNDKPRKSLRQLADEAAEADGANPWACPRCGCTDWRVVDSRLIGTTRRRQRACRNCHTAIPTLEVPVPKGYTVIVVPETIE